MSIRRYIFDPGDAFGPYPEEKRSLGAAFVLADDYYALLQETVLLRANCKMEKERANGNGHHLELALAKIVDLEAQLDSALNDDRGVL